MLLRIVAGRGCQDIRNKAPSTRHGRLADTPKRTHSTTHLWGNAHTERNGFRDKPHSSGSVLFLEAFGPVVFPRLDQFFRLPQTSRGSSDSPALGSVTTSRGRSRLLGCAVLPEARPFGQRHDFLRTSHSSQVVLRSRLVWCPATCGGCRICNEVYETLGPMPFYH